MVFQITYADLAGKRLAAWGLARVLDKFCRGRKHPKLPTYKSLYFLPAKLAQIDTYIRRYLNVSKIKINREKIGPFNFWLLSRPIFTHINTKFAYCKKQQFHIHSNSISF